MLRDSMVEIDDNVPFLWRLSSHSEEGFCVVSMVIPFNSGDENLEHTIETDVLSFTSDEYSAEEEEVLEWNEDDIELFLKLISNKKTGHVLKSGETIKIDLTDPETIEIVQIVAAAGFGLALPADNLLVPSSNTQIDFQCELGSQVSLNTVSGFKRCIVAEIEGDDVVCVMLEKVKPSLLDQMEEIQPHDLIMVKKYQILHPSYTSLEPSPADILH